MRRWCGSDRKAFGEWLWERANDRVIPKISSRKSCSKTNKSSRGREEPQTGDEVSDWEIF